MHAYTYTYTFIATYTMFRTHLTEFLNAKDPNPTEERYIWVRAICFIHVHLAELNLRNYVFFQPLPCTHHTRFHPLEVVLFTWHFGPGHKQTPLGFGGQVAVMQALWDDFFCWTVEACRNSKETERTLKLTNHPSGQRIVAQRSQASICKCKG